jgi:hypothetical protein
MWQPLAVDVDSYAAEEAFGLAYRAVSAGALDGDLDLSNVAGYSGTEREMILLLFAQCQDVLDGRQQDAPIEAVVTSENRTVHSEVLEKQLEQIEQRIERASKPVSLREITLQARVSEKRADGSDDFLVPSAVRRMVVGIMDLVVILTIAACIASAFERGGLPAVSAEISITGITARHYPLLLSTLALSPLVSIFYLMASFVIFGATLPGRLLSLELRTARGSAPKLRHCMVRAASMPLSLVVGGYLPIVLGKPAVPDRIACTRVVMGGGDD